MAGCCDHDHAKNPGLGDSHGDHPHSHGQDHDHDHRHDHHHDHEGDHCCTPAPIAFGSLAAPVAVADSVRTAIRIMQMDCPTEEALIRKKLGA